MINLQNDYHDIAHPIVLERLNQASSDYLDSYGNDKYCKEAKQVLRTLFNTEDFDLHFVHGGTVANILGLSSNLKTYEAIIAPKTSHIYVHETGALELRGHRIIPVDTSDGKLYVSDLEHIMNSHGDEFNVLPKVVCISNTTEFGSIYSKEHLKQLYDFCKENKLLLHIDGARLGSALESQACDYSWEDLPSLCDSLSIGGTKNGALFGEALIFFPNAVNDHFRFYLKSVGAMLAKGYLMGIQYTALFETGVYQENAKHANEMAKYLYDNLNGIKGLEFASMQESNQLFIYATDILEAKLKDKVRFETMPWIDGTKVIRFVTSYTTTKEEMNQILTMIGE